MWLRTFLALYIFSITLLEKHVNYSSLEIKLVINQLSLKFSKMALKYIILKEFSYKALRGGGLISLKLGKMTSKYIILKELFFKALC